MARGLAGGGEEHHRGDGFPVVGMVRCAGVWCRKRDAEGATSVGARGRAGELRRAPAWMRGGRTRSDALVCKASSECRMCREQLSCRLEGNRRSKTAERSCIGRGPLPDGGLGPAGACQPHALVAPPSPPAVVHAFPARRCPFSPTVRPTPSSILLLSLPYKKEEKRAAASHRPRPQRWG